MCRPIPVARRVLFISPISITKGDTPTPNEVIRTINELNPEFVCFTGDLVENIKYLDEALGFISQIQVPVYGSPGNHDYWCRAPFSEFQRVFSATGGRWLADTNLVLSERDLELVGMGHDGVPMLKLAGDALPPSHSLSEIGRGPGRPALRLDHGWSFARWPGPRSRFRALILPWGVGRYDLGYFKTAAGPLYVNAGIGTYRLPWRFHCRPEITVVTI